MKKNKFINTQGFTLVELMVVVGIIGILATIAIPNFRKYQAKSKTTEAKIQLSSVYTSMESMLLEYDTYATCLSSVGYNPSEDYANRFYGVGFTAVNATLETDAANNGLGSCSSSTSCTGAGCTGAKFFFAGGKGAAGFTPTIPLTATNSAVVNSSAISTSTFSAAAVGGIAAGSEIDTWEINNTKKMIHKKVGY